VIQITTGSAGFLSLFLLFLVVLTSMESHMTLMLEGKNNTKLKNNKQKDKKITFMAFFLYAFKNSALRITMFQH
jgi:hypothetical protein